MTESKTVTYKVGLIARLLNISERRVQQLAKDGIIPKPSHGKYDLIPCVQGYIKYLQNCITGNQTAAIDSNLERARLLKAKADKTEIEVNTLKGRLIATDEMERMWCAMLAAFRAKMLALPSKSAQLVAPLNNHHDIRRVLTDQVHEALSELAQYDTERIINPDPQMPSGSESAAAADSEPVGGSLPPPKQRGKRRTRQMED